jgi:hypothetical protein
MGRNRHITPHPRGWAVQPAGGQRVSSVHRTQAEAIVRGRGLARNEESELFIHRRNGRIRERDSYGRDEFPPEG